MSVLVEQMPFCRFFVAGKVKPKGSGFTAGVSKKTGKVFTRPTKQANQATAWGAVVKAAAQEAMGMRSPLQSTPISAVLTFCSSRPMGHFNKKGELRETFRAILPIVRPDADKLMRCVGDALTGVCIDDDSRITTTLLEKRWSTKPGVYITLHIDRSPADVEPREGW